MKKLLTKLSGIIFLIIFCNLSGLSQSTLYLFYQWPKIGTNVPLRISFNKEEVFSMSKNTKIECKFFSQGKLTIILNGRLSTSSRTWDYNDRIQINLNSGQSYFVRIKNTNSGGTQIGFELLNEEEGKKEFTNDRFKALKNYEEDPGAPVIIQQTAQNTNQTVNPGSAVYNKSSYDTIRNSDIDSGIPVIDYKNEFRFALVIGNEDYSSFQKDLGTEVNVAYAVNDARTFNDYCIKTLGIPDENVVLLINARTVELNREISKLNLYAKNSKGKAELIFYYAGHGLPDEITKEPYLIPVDVNGSDLKFAIKLTDLYSKLIEFPTQRITVFLDACFSGGARNQGLIAARGMKVIPKEEPLTGNLIVFTASSGDQSSLPYKEKKHGLFTYYLLKKFKETKGQLSYQELSDYLAEKVSLNSLRVNNKEQNPQTIVGPSAQKSWEQWKFN